MIALLTALFQAIAAGFRYFTKSLVGLGSRIYNEYFSAQAKRRKDALKRADEAIKKGDRKGLLDAITDFNKER